MIPMAFMPLLRTFSVTLVLLTVAVFMRCIVWLGVGGRMADMAFMLAFVRMVRVSFFVFMI